MGPCQGQSVMDIGPMNMGPGLGVQTEEPGKIPHPPIPHPYPTHQPPSPSAAKTKQFTTKLLCLCCKVCHSNAVWGTLVTLTYETHTDSGLPNGKTVRSRILGE